MSNKKIIDIDVQTGSFEKFYSLFETYSDKLEEMPAKWQKLDQAMEETGAGFTKQIARTKDLLAISATSTAAIVEAINLASKGQENFRKNTDKSASSIDKLKSKVSGLARGLADIAKTGGFLAGIAGVGGSLGIFDLASSVLSNQKQAGGLGLSVGQMRSWQANLSPFVGANVLQGAAGAQLDPSKYGYLSALGISGQQAAGEDAGTLAVQISNAARRAYQQNPNTNTAQAQSFFALGGTTADWRNLGTANSGFLASSEGAVGADAGALGYSPKTAQAWQQLSVQLSKAGYQIQSSLIDGLEPLAPVITQFSSAVSVAIADFLKSSDVRTALTDFATWLESPDFIGDMKSVWGGIKGIGTDIVAFGNWLHGMFPGVFPALSGGPGGGPPAPPAAPTPLTPADYPQWVKNLPSWMQPGGGGKNDPTAPSAKGIQSYYGKTAPYASIMSGFEALGNSKKLAASMASQAFFESSFDPSATSYDKKTGMHKGLFQWSATRRAAILKGTGIDVWNASPSDQVFAANWELTHTQKGAASAINGAPNYLAAGAAADKYYEVSGDNLVQQNNRGDIATIYGMTGPGAAPRGSGLPDNVTKLLAKLAAQNRQPQKVSLNITNSTSARVAMSMNAAAIG